MKIKVLLSHILFVSLALGMVWLASFIPSWVLNAIAILAFVGSIFLALLLGLIYLKKKNVIVCLLAVLGFTCSVHARSIEDCDMIYAASIEEGNYCRYMVLTDMYESGICKYIKTFNPTKALSGDPEKELQEQVNNADKIVQGYSELDKAHQDYESGACRLLTAEEQEKSVDERRTILKANSSAICCAWALQTLNQIYTSQNGERKIETVPMMLSDKRNQCWPCDVVYLLITLANTLAYRSAPAMAAVAMMFLKWFFIFWIALKIGALFMNRDFARDKKGNPQPYDGKKFLKELLARSCWVGLAALILMDTAKQLDYDATKNTARSVGGRPTTMISFISVL